VVIASDAPRTACRIAGSVCVLMVGPSRPVSQRAARAVIATRPGPASWPPQPAEVARLEALGAQVSIGQGDVSRGVMADPDGNEFDVLQTLTPDELPPGHDALGRRIAAGPRP
jgi:hypothetical protein